jgi:hypothetical protein
VFDKTESAPQLAQGARPDPIKSQGGAAQGDPARSSFN